MLILETIQNEEDKIPKNSRNIKKPDDKNGYCLFYVLKSFTCFKINSETILPESKHNGIPPPG